MEGSTETPSAVLPQGQNKPKMSRLGTKLKKKLSPKGRQKKPATEQRVQKSFSIGIVFTKGSIPKIECRQEAEEKAPVQQRAVASEPQNNAQGSQSSTTESTQKTTPSTQTSTSETSSTSMSSGEKAYRDYLNKNECRAHKKRTQLRLGRRVARWCRGGPFPPLEDFNEMSPTQISNYLRLQNISEDWIEAVVSQIAFVREKKAIPEEVEVDVNVNLKPPPSKWPWDENRTISMTLDQCIDEGMSYSQIGYFFYKLIYRQDDPIDNVVTKLKERGYSFSDMGHAMIDLFLANNRYDKGLIITEAKPYYGPDSAKEDEHEEFEEPPQPEPQRRKREKGKQKEGGEQRHQEQLNIQDWYHRPKTLEEERIADEKRSIKLDPGAPVPEGYKMIGGRGYRIVKAKSCVTLTDEPDANLPISVRGRRIQYLQPREDQKADTKSEPKRAANPKSKANKQDFQRGEDERGQAPQSKSRFRPAPNYFSRNRYQFSKTEDGVLYFPAAQILSFPSTWC